MFLYDENELISEYLFCITPVSLNGEKEKGRRKLETIKYVGERNNRTNKSYCIQKKKIWKPSNPMEILVHQMQDTLNILINHRIQKRT